MERSLNAIVDVLAICLNFMVILGLEIVADVSFGKEQTPLYALLLPVCLPLAFYAARKWVRNLALFLAVHAAAVWALIYLADLFPFPLLWKIVFGALGVLYAAISFRIRLTQNDDGEEELTAGFMAVMAVGEFFLCSYLGSDNGCAVILWLALLWLPGHWMRAYLRNFLGYMEMNRQSAGAMPEKRIFRGGVTAVGICGGLALALLSLCARTPLVAWMSKLVRKCGFALLRLLFLFLSLFPAGQEEDVPAAEEVVQQEQMMMYLPEAEEAPVWMQILDKVLVTAIAVLLLAGIVALIVLLVRYVIRSFYGREREKREVCQEGFVEEEERLGETGEGFPEKLPALLGTPAQKVRRIFKRTVKSAAKGREDAGIAARTARELAAWCANAEGAPSARINEWEELAALYERARYTEAEVTREDVHKAGRLSHRILH